MPSLKLLIAGRGPFALLAARMASARGYTPTLLFDPTPVPPFLVTGGRDGKGVLASLLREGGSVLSDSPSSRSGKETMLLYLGKVHRIVGCPAPSVLSPEEDERIFPGLRVLGESVFPEIESRMEKSYQSTATFFPWNRRLVNWFLEPERLKEDLPGQVRKVADSALSSWEPLLTALRLFTGLDSRKWNDAELIRALMHFVSGRARLVSPFGDLSEVDEGRGGARLSGVNFLEWDGTPRLLKKMGRRGQWGLGGDSATSSPDTLFDRVLSLSASPGTPLVEMTCSVHRPAVPSYWPSTLMTSEGEDSSLLIMTPGSGATRDHARMLFSGSADNRSEAWVGRWNRHSLFPFLSSGQVMERQSVPLLKVDRENLAPPKARTAYLKVGGHYTELTDPSLIPVVTEDWLADLSLALPSRTISL